MMKINGSKVLLIISYSAYFRRNLISFDAGEEVIHLSAKHMFKGGLDSIAHR